MMSVRRLGRTDKWTTFKKVFFAVSLRLHLAFVRMRVDSFCEGISLGGIVVVPHARPIPLPSASAVDDGDLGAEQTEMWLDV
jgi:hypothetical protein